MIPNVLVRLHCLDVTQAAMPVLQFMSSECGESAHACLVILSLP